MKIKKKIFVIAGSDSSGGAGIQADIKTITSLGSYAMTAITAVTSQNTTGVKSILPIPIKEIFKQITVTCNDIKPDSTKIGMLHSSNVITTVIKCIKKNKMKKIILDPVMVAKGGAKLIDGKAVNLLKRKLMFEVDLITPNIPEAEILSKIKIRNKQDMVTAAKKLIDLGVKNVLIKGGHLNSKTIFDIYANETDLHFFYNKKLKTKHTHGTGCTLSSAISTYYACGKTLKKSCEMAIKYVNQSIRSAPKLGKGHGPINHLEILNMKKNFR